MPRFAANLTMLFNEVPFMDRFALAAKAGFTGVEYLFPYEFNRHELKAALAKHNLAQVLHNLPAGNWAGGERGIAVLPDRVDDFRRGVADAIDYATTLNCSQVNCLSGIAPQAWTRMCCAPLSSATCVWPQRSWGSMAFAC
jgi:hydroxypyruvate isomerase